ncbi:MAG: DNA translocase FtsK 4TM domain-containing protein, partial [Anaerolineales bacterium]
MAKRTTRRSTTRRSTSTKRRRSSTKRRSYSRKRQPSLLERLLDLIRDRKRELIAIMLILVGLLTLVSMLSASQGLIASAWISILARGFGWGSFVIPLVFLAVGIWMLLQSMSKNLPRLESERVLGMVLLYLVALVVIQAIFGDVTFPMGAEATRWQGAGGALGAVLLSLMENALGIGGAIVAIIAWFLVSLTLTAGWTLPETLSFIWTGIRRFASTVQALWRTLFQSRKPARPSAKGYRDRLADIPAPESSPIPQPDIQVVSTPLAEEAPMTKMPRATVPTAGILEDKVWELPDLQQILEPGLPEKLDEEFDLQRGRLIEETLQAFGAPARVVEINRGPTVTQFGVEPGFVEGRGGRRTKVKVSKIASLADDLALALAAQSIRIEAPVPNKGYVGVEVPNAEIALVALRDIMLSENFQRIPSRLRLGLGRGVAGYPIAADLTAMPHLLIAG